jgi:hypothetical protein
MIGMGAVHVNICYVMPYSFVDMQDILSAAVFVVVSRADKEHSFVANAPHTQTTPCLMTNE